MDAYREQKRKREELAVNNNDSNGNNHVISHQTLFGSVPIGQETLYNFYKQQISALILKQIQDETGGAAAMESGLESKPVIVGLSLVLPDKKRTGGDQEDDDDEEGDFAALADAERVRYRGILDLISQARTW